MDCSDLNDRKISLQEAHIEINNYITQLLRYLETGVSNMKPILFMRGYTCVVKVSDENDMSPQLYDMFINILKTYLRERVIEKLDQTGVDA
jgi:hypothetical protein